MGQSDVADPALPAAAGAGASRRRGRVRDALAAHEHWTAAGLLALLVLVYLWPVLVEGKLLAPTAGMYYNVPWKGLAPAGLDGYVNRQLEDVTLSYYPWQVLARQLVHAGTFPAWNPHALAGTPFFANPEVAWLSPFTALTWVLPLTFALGLVAALKLWLAGFGAYLLVRELRLGFWPGLLAGVSFALCAFDVVWLEHGVQVSVAVLLPWTLWLVERIAQRGRAVDGLALAGVATLVLTGGHPGTQLHVLSGAVLYALVRAALSGGVAGRERLRRVGVVGAALLVGVLVTAVTLLPARDAALGAAGTLARRNGSVGFAGAHMPLGVLRTALFPDWWGRVSEDIRIGPATYNERTFYAGVVALVLALVALASARDWRRKAPFGVLAALGLAVPLHAPGIYGLTRSLPLFDTVQNQRLLLWFLLAVAIFGAFGLQALLDAPRERRVLGALATAVLAALVAIVTLDVGGSGWSQALHYLLHRSGTVTERALALASVGWWIVFVAALGGVVLLGRRRPQWRRLVGALVVLVAALDLLHFAHGYQPMGPAPQAVPPRTPAIAYLQRHSAEGRIAGTNYALFADFSTVFGLRDARGYDQPQPSLRYLHLWQAAWPGQAAGTALLLPPPSRTSLQVLGVLGARYLITDPGAQVHAATIAPVYRGRDATIIENRLALPRAIVAPRISVADGEEAEIATVAREGFDPRRTVVVRREEIGAAAPAGSRGEVRVVGDANARVTLRAHLQRAGLVVLDDAWAPGWSVTVDGRPARALQADVVLRGVVVPAGAHEVVWSYRVPGLALGAAVSGVGLVALGGWAGWLLLRSRRRRGRREQRA